MEEKLYTFDTLFISAVAAEHTSKEVKAKNIAKEYLREVILEKTDVDISLLEGLNAESVIFTFLRKEEDENGIRYLFNEDGGIVKIVNANILAEVKAFIEHENKNRGGNMSPEECFIMAASFFKGVQSQQKHDWNEVTEEDLGKILSEVVPVAAKSRCR